MFIYRSGHQTDLRSDIFSLVNLATTHFTDNYFADSSFHRQLFRRQSFRRQSFRRQSFHRQFTSPTVHFTDSSFRRQFTSSTVISVISRTTFMVDNQFGSLIKHVMLVTMIGKPILLPIVIIFGYRDFYEIHMSN